MNNAQKKRLRASFTLIELLVVMAVIAVLASLLLPALSRSKTSAQGIQCVNSLRQLGLASQLYLDDNSGNCFRFNSGATNGGQLYWFGWLGPGAEGERPFDAQTGALFHYLQDRGIALCPALDYALRQFKLKATGASYGYGVNLRLAAIASAPPVNVAKISRASTTVFFSDAAQVNTFQAPASPDNPMLEEFYYVSTNQSESTAHFRHNQRANATFLDMHVEGEKMSPGSLDQRLPSQFVGRLPPEVL